MENDLRGVGKRGELLLPITDRVDFHGISRGSRRLIPLAGRSAGWWPAAEVHPGVARGDRE